MTNKEKLLVDLLKELEEEAREKARTTKDAAAIGHYQGVAIVYRDIIKMIEDDKFFEMKVAEHFHINKRERPLLFMEVKDDEQH